MSQKHIGHCIESGSIVVLCFTGLASRQNGDNGLSVVESPSGSENMGVVGTYSGEAVGVVPDGAYKEWSSRSG